jgi:hypothetical protein
MTIKLIGYDVRRSPVSLAPFRWDPPTREQFLLRPEVKCPLSVDKSVWPSRFFTPGAVLDFGDEIRPDPVRGNPYFVAFDLWNELDEMLAAYVPGMPDDCGIALGLLVPEDEAGIRREERDPWWSLATQIPTRPSDVGANWASLGFDVANSGFLSALSNCGSPEKELAQLRARWATHINDKGLFLSASEAEAFCIDANVRVAPDGPFHVFEVFLLWGQPF